MQSSSQVQGQRRGHGLLHSRVATKWQLGTTVVAADTENNNKVDMGEIQRITISYLLLEQLNYQQCARVNADPRIEPRKWQELVLLSPSAKSCVRSKILMAKCPLCEWRNPPVKPLQ